MRRALDVVVVVLIVVAMVGCESDNMEACKKMCMPRMVQSYNGGACGSCVCGAVGYPGYPAEEPKK